MSKICFFAGLITMLPAFLAAQNTYVPDDNFEQTLIDLGFDSLPLDDYVPTANISAVTILDVSSRNIRNLTGIEDFAALTELDCAWNQLTSLDLIANPELIKLYCSSNQLTSLGLRGNAALTNLDCGNNNLTVLDLSANPALISLDCSSDNQLTTLDLSANPALTYLDCYDIQLTVLDLSANPALAEIRCGGNQLTTLDLSANPALAVIRCGGNQLTTLDLSANPALIKLNCWWNQLTSLDLSANAALIRLECRNNQLTSLNIQNGANGNMKSTPGSLVPFGAIGMNATGNPDLTCIQVDDAMDALSYNGYWFKDATAGYSTNCGLSLPLVFPSGGDTQSVSFQANTPWLAIVSDDWISIDANSGSAGSHLLEFEVAPSDLAVSRFASITIISDSGEVFFSLTIEQAAMEGDYAVPLAMSVRADVGSGANILIPGMIFKGPNKTKVVIRGVGPALASAGVTGTLNDPEIMVYSGETQIAGNDDWQEAPQDLVGYFQQVGLTTLDNGSKDAAAYLEFDPGIYTMHLKGVNSGKGIGLAEVYVVAPEASCSGLVALSARAEVGTGVRVVIPGFVITGNQSRRVLIRGVGPGLAASNVPDYLPDPQIEVYQTVREEGVSTSVSIGTNEDWGDDEPDTLSAAFVEAGLSPFASGSKDAAILVTLPPGVYTAHIRSSDGTLGVALLEIYFLD